MFLQRSRKFCRRTQTIRSGLVINFTINNLTTQISTCCQYDAFGFKHFSCFCFNPDNFAVRNKYFINHQLFDIKIFLILNYLFHNGMIIRLISLGTQSVDRIAFTSIQHTHLDTSFISGQTHLTAQSINFTHQMTLSRSSHRRITRHKGYVIKRKSRHQSLTAKTCRSQSSFDASMTGTDNNYIIFFTNQNLSLTLAPICRRRIWQISH